jgi:DNA-directed RNA polymerase specialized sigma24 family protein
VIHEYKRRVHRESLDDAGPSALERPLDPGADTVELRQAIGLVMIQLAPKDREILRAFFLDEHDKSEICRTMGLSDIQFRVALFRAKKNFREIYRQSVKQKAAKQH